MRIIKDKQIVEDNWKRVADDQDLSEGDTIISFRRWKASSEDLKGREGRLAICIDGDDELEDVAKVLDQFNMIAVDFPSYADGRCYSHARRLRDRYAYEGELRAVGDVLRDQLYYMARCGIDAFQLREDKDIEDALNAFNEYTVKYQAAADVDQPLYRIR